VHFVGAVFRLFLSPKHSEVFMVEKQLRDKRQQQAKTLRIFRRIHRITGACLFFFFLFVSVSGLFLGWKKHSGNLILPKTYTGSSTQLEDWMPIAQLHDRAIATYKDSLGATPTPQVDRMDVRAAKGTIKFTFKDVYWEVQLDGATGQALHIGKRNSDFFEQIHDGSIIDRVLGSDLGAFKLFYTNVMGIALLVFSITGFWLWYGPKKMRAQRG
jgi:uncharacterized iron-regulated membrane protein